MSGRFDKFFDYAYEKGRDIAKKFHGNKGDKMDKKGMNIESYDGQDAFYTGTDEEYEEFLKNVDVKTDNDADAEPVENTQRINLNETINIQSVIDKFKKKAGDIENGARKFKDTVVSKVDEFKAKKEAENTTEAENEKEEKKKDNSFEKVVKTAEDIKEDIKNAVDESGIIPLKIRLKRLTISLITFAKALFLYLKCQTDLMMLKAKFKMCQRILTA